MLYLLKDGTKIQKKTALSGMPDLIIENKGAEETIVQYFNVCETDVRKFCAVHIASNDWAK